MEGKIGLNFVILTERKYGRMKNCVNCEHFEVCVVVHDRKRRQAGDYSPCGKWKAGSGEDDQHRD